jgi:ribonucleoside-diphosphate reductase beta chain
MSIFEPRVNYKPFEYNEVLQFVDAINKTYWIHSEVDFTADKQDFSVSISDKEKSAIKNSLLAISQIEVAVKSFWGKLYEYIPKPEFNNLGATFSECEVRHAEAYSRLLDVMDISDSFKDLMNVPEIKGRVDFLSSYLKKKVPTDDKKKYALALVIFSLFIENVSLFSQFAIILSFTRFKGLLKNTSNIIAWTSKDEQVHANAGIWLFNTIKKEYPELFDEDMKNAIHDAAIKAIEVETEILDWIFREGEINTISKKDLISFMKNRINISMKSIGMRKPFNVLKEDIEKMKWFDEEINANTLDDFFAKRPVEYSKFTHAVSADNLF